MSRSATPRRAAPMLPWSAWIPALTYGLAEWLALARSRAQDRRSGATRRAVAKGPR